MLNRDFEPDVDLGRMQLANDPDGRLLVNTLPAEEFPHVSQDIEGLMFLGRLTSSFVLYGHSFSLQTLTRGEKLAITQYVKDYEDTIGLTDALQTGFLALALTEVDGRPISIPLSPDQDNPLVRLHRNFPVVSRMYDQVLEALYAEYSKLLIRQAQAFQVLEGKSQASRRTN
jgi:hypothetical protein